MYLDNYNFFFLNRKCFTRIWWHIGVLKLILFLIMVNNFYLSPNFIFHIFFFSYILLVLSSPTPPTEILYYLIVWIFLSSLPVIFFYIAVNLLVIYFLQCILFYLLPSMCILILLKNINTSSSFLISYNFLSYWFHFSQISTVNQTWLISVS